jgi:hypothetical protein
VANGKYFSLRGRQDCKEKHRTNAVVEERFPCKLRLDIFRNSDPVQHFENSNWVGGGN